MVSVSSPWLFDLVSLGSYVALAIPCGREDALNEIRILASIKHRNIIRYCDAFTEKDNLYIVMEFAEHGDIGRQARALRRIAAACAATLGPLCR